MSHFLFSRFPRIKTIRHDKGWSDCMTSSNLALLTAPNQGKLAKRRLDVDESLETETKKRKVSAIKQTTVDLIYQPSHDLAHVKAKTNTLKDKIIVVEPLPNDKDGLKSRLEKIVVELGGKIEQNVKRGRTWAYIQTGKICF